MNTDYPILKDNKANQAKLNNSLQIQQDGVQKRRQMFNLSDDKHQLDTTN